MKVSYIIMPFEDSTYLIRCVNSLYRQLGENYEVILAENVFDENIVDFLSQIPQIKLISENPRTNGEKLAEAFTLICDDSNYVQFIDVTTVVSPILTNAILSSEESDVILTSLAVHTGDSFAAVQADILNLIKNPKSLICEQVCFRVEAVKKLISGDFDFYSVLLLKIIENASFGIVDEICMYVDNKAENDAKVSISSEITSECIDNIYNLRNADMRIAVAGVLIDIFLEDEDYSSLRELGRKCENDLLLEKLFKAKTFCSAGDFVKLNDDEYPLYITVEAERDEGSEAARSINEKKQFEEINKSLEDIKKEIAFIKSKPPVISIAKSAPVLTDPSTEVPKMYYEGRLGLKTILKSFRGWLKFKFSKKKK